MLQEMTEIYQANRYFHHIVRRQRRVTLETDLKETKMQTYALGTWQNWYLQWKSFYRLCDIYEWPVSEHTLYSFAQHLAYIFKSTNSVRNYLSGVVKLHVMWNKPQPELQNFEIVMTLRDLKKVLHAPMKQAQPMTPQILIDMYDLLDLDTVEDAVLWAAILSGFYGMLRKSNLAPNKSGVRSKQTAYEVAHCYRRSFC